MMRLEHMNPTRMPMAAAVAAWMLLLVAPSAAPAPARSDTIKVQVGDVTRTCTVHLPVGYDGTRQLPLVISCHGSGSTGAAMGWAFNALADRESFIAAYPDGITGDNRGWTALFGKPIPGGHGAQVDDVDDVGFIRNLIDHMHTTYHTDPARVFVAGHSAGAYMAFRVANDLADRVAAAGVVNGSMGIRVLNGEPSIPDIPPPVAPVSIVLVRGALDKLVPLAGARSDRVVAFSVQQCLDHFVSGDGCSTQATVTRDEQHGVTRTLYPGGKAGTEVEFVLVDRANHNWPGVAEGFGTSAALWDFFSKHPKAP